MRERIDQFGVSEPEISRIGAEPDLGSAARRPKRPGSDRPDRDDGAALLLRLREERDPAEAPRQRRPGRRGRAALHPPLQRRRRRREAQARVLQGRVHDHRAHLLPVRQDLAAAARRPGGDEEGPLPSVPRRASSPPTPSSRACPRAPWCSRTRRPTARPPTTRRPATTAPPPTVTSCSRIARRSRARTSPTRSSSPTRTPTSPTSPSTSPTPGAAAFQKVTRADRPARRLEAAGDRRHRPERRRQPLRQLRRRARRADQVTGDHQLRREPRGDRRPNRRSDLGHRRHHGGPGPGRGTEDRRAAGQALGDQPEHRLGDPRPGGAGRRGQGRPGGPRDRRLVPALLLPLPRARRGPRPDRLRPLLPGDDQGDPDHADPAGHRRTGPDDRGRGRRQHRHLRANKGRGPPREIDALGDLAGLQEGHRDDHRRERHHPADGVHPLRPRDRDASRDSPSRWGSARSSRCSPRSCSPRRSSGVLGRAKFLRSPSFLGSARERASVDLRLLRCRALVLLDLRRRSCRSARSGSRPSSSTSASTSSRARGSPSG